MTIIDMHVHIGEPKHFPEPVNVWMWNPYFKMHHIKNMGGIEIARALKAEGVEKAVVVALDLPSVGVRVPNEYVAEAVKDSEGFFIGFASVDPNDPRAEERLDYALSSLNLKGLKLYPPCQYFYPNDFKLTGKLYKKCCDYGVPVAFHTGPPGVWKPRMIFDNLAFIDEVANEYKDLKIILLHHEMYVNPMGCAALASMRENVYIDLSGSALWWELSEFFRDNSEERFSESDYFTDLREIFETIGSEPGHFMEETYKRLLMFSLSAKKIVFGSDFPAVSPRWFKQKLEKLIPSEKIRRQIFHENAKKILNI